VRSLGRYELIFFGIVIACIFSSCYQQYVIDAGCDAPCRARYSKYGGQVRGVLVDDECHCEPVGVRWWK
jgi:hypothetical protein